MCLKAKRRGQSKVKEVLRHALGRFFLYEMGGDFGLSARKKN